MYRDKAIYFWVGQDEIKKGNVYLCGEDFILTMIRSITQVSKGKLSLMLSNIIEMGLSALKWTTEVCIVKGERRLPMNEQQRLASQQVKLTSTEKRRERL